MLSSLVQAACSSDIRSHGFVDLKFEWDDDGFAIGNFASQYARLRRVANEYIKACLLKELIRSTMPLMEGIGLMMVMNDACCQSWQCFRMH